MSGPGSSTPTSLGRDGRTAGGRLMDALPATLSAIAEGAWVAAVYAVVQAAAHGPTPLGPAPLALAAAAGLVIARRWGPGLGERWPRVALAMVAAAGAVGWLAEPSAIRALVALDPEGALRAHPGGLLAGLAFLRGIAHARAATSEDVFEHLVDVGLPGLVLPVLVTGTLPEPGRGQALGQEVVATVVFLIAGTVGLAVTRLVGIASATGFDWHRNRAWLALVALLAVAVATAALPAALVVGPVVRVIVAALVLPILFLGAIVGVAQVRLRHLLSLLFMLVGLVVVATFAGRVGPGDEQAGRTGFGAGEAPDSVVVDVAAATALVLLVVGGILVLARLWMRETLRAVESDVAEERTIDQGPSDRSATRPVRPRRRYLPPSAPVDAPGAYLALLRDLEDRPEVRRAAGESPAEHARRLRAESRGADGLDLLAADYALARFAARRLTPGEERRAIARWRRLRHVLRGAAGP